MADETALLRAVMEHPDDDAPRLAYAEWCARQADPATNVRGAFIRAQIEYLHLDADALSGVEGFMLERRIRLALDTYGTAWAAPILPFVEFHEFRRGFVELVVMSARNFLEHAPELFAAAPVQHVDLKRVRDVTEELFAFPYFSKLRSLGMNKCGLYNLHVQILAASPVFEPLRWLSVAENNLERPAAEALATSPYLKQLTFAQFLGNPFDPGEQQGMDSGEVVASWLPHAGLDLEARYGYLSWLHRDGDTSRFAA